jgi:hypothetical protein
MVDGACATIGRMADTTVWLAESYCGKEGDAKKRERTYRMHAGISKVRRLAGFDCGHAAKQC